MAAASQELAPAPAQAGTDIDIETPAEQSTGHKNTVRQLVEEVCNLMGDTHDLREDSMAHGVQFHTLNVMVEMGLHDKPEEQAEMMKTALAASKKAHGGAAITEERLKHNVDTLVLLEKDIGHVRRLAQLQNINLQAFNFLTQIIRLNPGDGGEKTINDFVAYAALCEIKLEKFKGVAEEYGGGKNTVLPEIDCVREDEKRQALNRWLTDIIVGLAIGVSVFWIFF